MDAPALSVSEAQARLLARFRRLDAENVELFDALGRTLAADTIAAGDLPPFTNSAMDGYAVRATDTAGASAANPVTLRVVGLHAAGDFPSLTITSGQAAAITTGAPLPAGADAVVRLEETDGGTETVAIRAPVVAGANVRRQAEIVRAGTTVLRAGGRLGPGDIALLAATGIARSPVVRRPRIGVLSTGNELVLPGQTPREGQIVDVNGQMLAALVAYYGGSPVPLGIARDSVDDLRHALHAARDVDCIITSGGVSVGAYDAVRAVIADAGTLDFWQVRMRPGRPVAFGRLGETPFLALPGNPVAAFVTFHCFARPAIARMLGRTPEISPTIPACVTRAIESRGSQQTYLRAQLRVTETGWEADVLADQGVGNVLSLSAANALVIVPEGVQQIAGGETVHIMPLD